MTANKATIAQRGRVSSNWPGLRKRLRLALILGVLVILSIFTAMPFVYMLTGAFKTNGEIFTYPLTIIPRHPTTANYIRLLNGSEIPFLRQFTNSVFTSVSQTLLSLLVSSWVGWGFAKYSFRAKNALFLFLLATMMFPGQVSLVPLFLLMLKFGWLDTYWAIIIPGAASAFGVFFMRQIMIAVPDELLDAGRIDGTSEFGMYWRIGLPLSGAGLSILSVLTFLGAWNNYMWPLIALRSAEKFTFPLGLASLFGLYKIEYGMILGGLTLATLPILILFIIGRDQFVAGIAQGAIKG